LFASRQSAPDIPKFPGQGHAAAIGVRHLSDKGFNLQTEGAIQWRLRRQEEVGLGPIEGADLALLFNDLNLERR
jgi:hypothetical protein